MDIKANTELSKNFPCCPSFMEVSLHTNSVVLFLKAEKDGMLVCANDSTPTGTWWGLSATCVCLELDGLKKFFRFTDSGVWESNDEKSRLYWTRKRGNDNTPSRMNDKTPTRAKCTSPMSRTPNISRFRMSILPVHELDSLHWDQLQCMGLRLCFHTDVGRVLVSAQRFEEGQIIIYSKVQAIDVKTDEDVTNIVDPTHPSCCYLLAPRTKKLYYNRGSFSDEDPVASGDLWYLVNHSCRPNTDVQLRANGIQLRAKQIIQPNEPITWTYPFGFFSKDEVAIDLPRNIIPDDSVFIRE